MDPTIATVYLVASSIWKAVDGTELVKTAIDGILGNRADWAFGHIRKRLLGRGEDGQIVNHDVQRAVYEAYLNATLLACLKPLETARGLFATNDAYFSDEAKSLRRISRYIDDEREKFRDVNYIPAASLATDGQLERLLVPDKATPAGAPAVLATQLKDQLLGEIALLFDGDTELTVPDSFRTTILTGWQDGKGRQDWFEWVCGFFHEYLKTRPRLSEILEKEWLAELVIDSQALTIKVTDIEKSLATMSGQVVELIELVKQLDGKTDELLEYSRLIPLILELLQGNPPTPARAKYLNAFARYDFARLIGRENEIKDIDAHFTRNKLLLLRGMGGVGKTTLARAYLDRVHATYDHLAYVDITGTIADSMLAQLGNSPDVAFTANPQHSTDEKFNALIDTLRRIPKLLLVLDNIRDASHADDLRKRKTSLESLDAMVLITGRVRMSEFVQARQFMEIGSLSPDEAFLLFERYLGRSVKAGETDLVKDLLEKAFYHAKLIEIIATQISRNIFLTVDEANAIVTRRQFEHEEINFPDGLDEQAKTIYQILLDLFNTDPLADDLRQLLRYFSVLPAIDIPAGHLITLLGVSTAADRRLLTKKLLGLAQTAWLDQLDGTYFSMHGLVQWVVRQQLKPTATTCEPLLRGMSNALHYEPTESPLDGQIYLPYSNEWLTLFTDQTEPLATSFNKIASTYGVLGEQKKRLVYNLKALDIQEAVRPPDYLDLAVSYNNIALTYGALGQHDKCMDYLLKALAIQEAVLPTNHPELATSYSNLSGTYGALGQHEKQLAYDLKALAIRETVLPANHPDLARSFNNIAITYLNAGDWEQAMAYIQRSLSIREAVLPLRHPDLAQSYNNIALIYRALGQQKKCLDYLLKSLAILKVILPINHPDLATSFNNIASTYGALGQQGKRLDYHLKALAIREAVLSSNHPDLATSFNNIAETYGALDQQSKCLDYHLKALAIREAVLSSNHPELAQSYSNIAAAYGALGEHEKRLAYDLEALAIREVTLPPNHPDLVISYNNTAVTYGALGEQEKELDYFLKTLMIREAVLPANHPDLATSYNNIAFTYNESGEQNKALTYHLKAMTILEAMLPSNNLDLAQSYNNIAATYRALAGQEECLTYLLKALAIFEAALPPIHPDLAASHNNIAVTYYNIGDWEKAQAYIQKAVGIREIALPPNHPDLINSKENLAFLEQAIRERDEQSGLTE